MTKDELLQKGLSEDDANEIINALESKEDPEDSVQLLEKALNGDPDGGVEPDEDLLKAKKEDDKAKNQPKEDDSGDGKDDYDEKYMKKHMPRYMKENKKSCGKMAKETGVFADDMKKAIDGLDTDMDGAVVEMADLKPILEKLPEVIESMAKAIGQISDQVVSITDQNEKSFDIMKKAGQVTVETSKSIDGFLSQPTGKKGKDAPPAGEMKKASEVSITQENVSHVYRSLMKATKDGDRTAGKVISAFESAGKDINRLNPEHKKYIGELLQKEVN